jgi:hypothetical protein
MNKELLDWAEEAYDIYLTNFEVPICPPELDVQPEFYLPMTKELFIKSLLEDNQRGEIFRQKWGVNIDIRELSLAERKKIYSDIHIPGFMVEENVWLESKLRSHNIPKHAITLTLTYNNKTVEVYE